MYGSLNRLPYFLLLVYYICVHIGYQMVIKNSSYICKGVMIMKIKNFMSTVCGGYNHITWLEKRKDGGEQTV